MRLHRFEEDVTRTFELEAACTVVGLVMAQVGLDQSTIELAEPNDGLVGMFVPGTSDGIKNANGSQEGDCLAGCRQQLLDSLRVVAGLAEHLVVKYCQLICADNQRISGVDRNRFRLSAREVSGKLSRFQVIVIAFVDLGIHSFVGVEKAIEQATTVR